MITSPTALLRAALVVLAFLPALAFGTLSDQTPPSAVIVREDFAPLSQEWQPVTGAWSVDAGKYNSTAAGTTDISRIVNYREIDPSAPPQPTLHFDRFTLSARMRIRGAGAGTVGIVYRYQDSANYYEALLSSNGTVSLRRTRFGATTQLASTDLHIQREVWYLVEIKSDQGSNTLIAVGMADTPTNDVANPTLGAVFCVGPTNASAINKVAGLPGPARITITGTAVGSP